MGTDTPTPDPDETSGILEQRPLASAIAEVAQDLVDVLSPQSLGICLPEPTSDTMTCHPLVDLPGIAATNEPCRVQVPGTVVEEVMRSGRGRILDDPTAEPRSCMRCLDEMATIMVVPILHRGTAVGAIVAGTGASNAWGRDDVLLVVETTRGLARLLAAELAWVH